MSLYEICAPCLFGLESVLSHEVSVIGGQDVRVTDGRVLFRGDESVVAKANLWLRCAERVCIVLGSFEAKSFEELFVRVGEIALEDFIGRKDAFPVTGWSLKSGLHSVPDCQSIIKKAVVKRLEKAYGLSWFEETGPVHQLRFSILRDVVTLMLDTSGEGLHKRGYRAKSVIAPLKETLAAGIADLARVMQDDTVYDPMCGSGTLLIESALRAFNIAPGVRRKFVGEKWGLIPQAVWQNERKAAMEAVRKGAGFKGHGADLDAQAVSLTLENAAKAGVGKKITALKRDIGEFSASGGKSMILCNPPYGERMLEVKQAEELYKKMGKAFAGQSCCIISPHEQFEAFFGRKADKRRKLYNGMIKCQLFMYFR
ncbi:MAG: class I SAM-dependent RNA methyltransferase [Oscillospiraceae bacterium]|nr:class I SAM-dependent RNA methyltransferase [Oscillospiraceae bacterium]